MTGEPSKKQPIRFSPNYTTKIKLATFPNFLKYRKGEDGGEGVE